MSSTNSVPPAGVERRKQVNLHLFSGALVLLDWLLIVVAGLIIFWAYPEMPQQIVPPSAYLVGMALGATITVLLYAWFGAYRPTALINQSFPAPQAILGFMSAVLTLLLIAFALQITDYFSRVWAVTWFIIAPLAVVTMHQIVRTYIRGLAKRKQFAMRTLIFGAGEYGDRLVRHLKEQADPTLEIVGFVDDRTARVPGEVAGVPVLGGTEKLISMVRAQEVDQVMIALPWGDKSRLDDLISAIGVTPVSILLAPDVGGYLPTGRSILNVADVPMLQVQERPFSGWGAILKDVEDRVLAFMFILMVAPLLALIALLIKLDSPGPVIFKQRRYGYNNQEILVWKFRSMYARDCDVTGTRQATKDDPRITRIGRFLRKSSLDELPQLFNVLRGEMSIVGPRPHAVSTKIGDRLFSELVNRYDARHKVKPGITGWAQVNGWRGETDTVEKIQKRVEFDLYYIENWSLWFDILIIIKTVFLVVKDDKAY